MAFKEDGYEVIRGAVPKEVVNFLKVNFDIHEYAGYLMKPPTKDTPFPHGDIQTPTSFAFYSPLYGDSLLVYVKPLLEHVTDVKLIETYSYMRVYYANSDLKKHVDRESCEISATVCIKKETNWPIWVEKTTGEQQSIELEEGDLVVYRGNIIQHWRDKFEGKRHYQVFLHYVDANGKFGEEYRWDKRPGLWMPPQTRKN